MPTAMYGIYMRKKRGVCKMREAMSKVPDVLAQSGILRMP